MCRLSLTMIVKDEEKQLARCLNSVKEIVDEIIIVDTGSKDRTKEIAYTFGAKVYDFLWINDFSAARNYAIEKSTGDWNLILDADEYITNDCKDTIKGFIKNNQAIGKIAIINSFMRDGELQYNRTYISRLAPKSTFFKGRIHEQLSSDLARINLDVEVFHDGYMETGKAERNLALLLTEAERDSGNPYLLYQIATTLFVSNRASESDQYFKAFYKYAPMNANYRYSGIVSYLYNLISLRNFEEGLEIIEKEKSNLSELPDFHFVCALFFMELVSSNVQKYKNYFPFIEQEYLACLKIGETKNYDSVVGTGSFCAAYNLGTFYEVTGNIQKAIQYYELASNWGYQKARDRLVILKR